MAKRPGIETLMKRQRQDGRLHFQYPPLWRERFFEWVLPILWALMPIVAIIAWLWASGRSG